MPLNDKEKRRFVAIAKEMKKKKNFVIKQTGMRAGITEYQKAQKELLELKEEYKDCPAVVQKAEENYKKLQGIIDDLNEYMRVLHPEGLLDLGSGSSGQFAMGQG